MGHYAPSKIWTFHTEDVNLVEDSAARGSLVAMDPSLLLPRPSRPFTPSHPTVRNASRLVSQPASSVSPSSLSAAPFLRSSASARTCVRVAVAMSGRIPPREPADSARTGGSGGRGTVAAASLKRPPVGLGAEGALAEEVAAEAVEDLLGEGESEGEEGASAAVADVAGSESDVDRPVVETRCVREERAESGTRKQVRDDHWRHTLKALGASGHRVFAIDLLGYGYSDKPTPCYRIKKEQQPEQGNGAAVGAAGVSGGESEYTFENWGQQAVDFIDQVVGEEAFIVTNSVGGVVALQAAATHPSKVRGLLLLNISLRNLHIRKQPFLARPFVSLLQSTLRSTSLGEQFFASVATPRAVRNVLRQCYGDPATVTDELVDLILKPGLQPGAVDVFLDFICYSGGPLPEDLLPKVQCPVLFGWGQADPWEPVEQGRTLKDFPCVVGFEEFPGVGHCPQDEAPHIVNPLIERFVAQYNKVSSYGNLESSIRLQTANPAGVAVLNRNNTPIARSLSTS
ncbi:unnamed protein product [Closterium sp. Yama58-4]|nr:unnamed protein product [Closterium sp. Yama58-4]